MTEKQAFQVRDPGFRERVRASFATQRAMTLVGAEIVVVEPGLVEIELPFSDGITQQHGFVHGGIVAMVADSAAGYAANTLTDADASVLTVEYKINFVAPAEGERLVARGEVVKSGRTLLITRAEVFGLRDGKMTPCAVMQQTIMAMAGKKEGGPRHSQ